MSFFTFFNGSRKNKLIGESLPDDLVAKEDPETLHGLFEQQVVRHPQRTALVEGEKALTFSELNDRAEGVAHFLLTTAALTAGDCVGLFFHQSAHYVIALLGILKAGGVAVPVDDRLKGDKANHVFCESDCRIILTSGAGVEMCRRISRRKVATVEEISAAPSPVAVSGRKGNDVAIMIYTSGTTGFPKGVLVEHRGLINTARGQIKIFGLNSRDRILQYSSIYYDSSLAEIFTSLFSGACLVIFPTETVRNRRTFVGTLKKQRVSVVTMSPSAIERYSLNELSPLRVLVVAGEILYKSQVKKFVDHIRCFNGYGLTETSVCATCEYIDPKLKYGSIIPVGLPLDGMSVEILDNDLQPVPEGQRGEICISGVGLSRGYLNQMNLNEEKFVEHPRKPGVVLFRSGDLGSLLPGTKGENSRKIICYGRMDQQKSKEQPVTESSQPNEQQKGIVEYLRAEGYRPVIDSDGDIEFRSRGVTIMCSPPGMITSFTG